MVVFDIRTTNVKIPESKVVDDYLIFKIMYASSAVYKDNRVMCDKKLSYYLLSLYVDYDLQKKACIDSLKRYQAFKENDQE